eukprot:2800364-Rhodomonas_salina.1
MGGTDGQRKGQREEEREREKGERDIHTKRERERRESERDGARERRRERERDGEGGREGEREKESSTWMMVLFSEASKGTQSSTASLIDFSPSETPISFGASAPSAAVGLAKTPLFAPFCSCPPISVPDSASEDTA